MVLRDRSLLARCRADQSAAIAPVTKRTFEHYFEQMPEFALHYCVIAIRFGAGRFLAELCNAKRSVSN